MRGLSDASARWSRSNSRAGRLDQAARRAEAIVAGNLSETDQKFVRRGIPWRPAARAWPGHSGGQAGPAIRSARPLPSGHRWRSGPAATAEAGRRWAATMVDSMPRSVGPASTTNGIRRAEAGQHVFGAKSGSLLCWHWPMARQAVARSRTSRACIAGCAGTRRPIVGSPAVTIEAMSASAPSGTDQGQRSRPNAVRQAPLHHSPNVADALGGGEVWEVNDQRVETTAGPWPRR